MHMRSPGRRGHRFEAKGVLLARTAVSGRISSDMIHTCYSKHNSTFVLKGLAPLAPVGVHVPHALGFLKFIIFSPLQACIGPSFSSPRHLLCEMEKASREGSREQPSAPSPAPSPCAATPPPPPRSYSLYSSPSPPKASKSRSPLKPVQLPLPVTPPRNERAPRTPAPTPASPSRTPEPRGKETPALLVDSADEESGSDEEEDERGSPGRTPVTGKTVRFSEMEEVLEFDSEDRRMSTGSYGTWSTSSSHGDASFGSCDRKRSFEEGSSGGEVDDAGQASEDESTVSTVDELIDEVEALYNGDVFGGVSVGQVAAPSKSAAFDANPTLHFPPSPPFPHLSPTKPILHPQRSIDYSGPESDIRGLFRTSSASSGAGSLSQSASEARDGQDLPLRLPSLPRIIFPSLPPLSLPSTPPPKSAAVVPNRLATPIRPARRPTTSGSLARQGRRISIGEEDTVGEKQRRRIPRRSVSVGGIRESANGQDSVRSIHSLSRALELLLTFRFHFHLCSFRIRGWRSVRCPRSVDWRRWSSTRTTLPWASRVRWTTV